jgi:hypothetical protein
LIWSVLFFNILTDKAGGIVSSYIRNIARKKQIFRDTLDYLPNGVLLIDVKQKKLSF